MTVRQVKTVPYGGEEKLQVVLIDYGVKQTIIRSLTARGCRVTIVPAGTRAAEILSMEPDGIMLSDSPGDPAENYKSHNFPLKQSARTQ